jgi:hypothetical protein
VKERVDSGPLTVLPVKMDEVPLAVEAVHVFNSRPVVSLRMVEVPEVRVASIVTAPVWVTPFVSSVVAEAVLANAIGASAATATAPRILLDFIPVSFRLVNSKKPPPRKGTAS